jgi:hypothetical protein
VSVFISYRRFDTAGHAGRLFDRLAARFGREQVFMDVDTIQPGQDFAQAISERVATSEALVALIGDQWLTATDERGRRRLDDPADFVRLELRAALERGVPVIPVLVEGAKMPDASALPEPLKPLARLQALEVSDARFDAEAQDLVRVLEQHVRPPAPRPWRSALRRYGLPAAAIIALLAAGALFFSSRAPPVDVTGVWRGESIDSGGRPFPIRLDLRQEGNQLLGTVTYPAGVGGIRDGKVEGERVSFVSEHTPQFSDQRAVTHFAGTVAGDELTLTIQSDANVREFVARRAPN